MEWEIIKYKILNEIKMDALEDAPETIDFFKHIMLIKTDHNVLNNTEKTFDKIVEIYSTNNFQKINDYISELSLKLEAYLKKIFLITENKLYEKTFAPMLKKVFKEKLNISKSKIDNFFSKKPEDLKSEFDYASDFKKAYILRNEEGHTAPKFSMYELIDYWTSTVRVYLYVTSKYKNDIKNSSNFKINENRNVDEINTIKTLNSFNKNSSYFLLTDSKINSYKNDLNILSKINFDYIIDLDPNSEKEGLYYYLKKNLEKKKAINQIILKDHNLYNFSYFSNSVNWLFACGNTYFKESKLNSTSIFEWKKKYLDFTIRVLKEFYNQMPKKQIFFIIMTNNEKFVEEFISIMNNVFGEIVKFIFFKDNFFIKNQFQDDNIHTETVDLYYSEFISAIDKHIQDDISNNEILFPAFLDNKEKICLPIDEFQLVNRFFEVVHLNILNNIEENSDYEFYQGREIFWKELDNNYDVKRDISKVIEDKVKYLLESRTSILITLNYEPGAGATTLLRRISYNLHHLFPVLILKNYNKTETVDELIRVFQLTNKPLLVIIDDKVISEQ